MSQHNLKDGKRNDHEGKEKQKALVLQGGVDWKATHGLESDWTVRPSAIFVATDSRVYVSRDDWGL
jgi:hypothetical protein